jgi:hypothetical protein
MLTGILLGVVVGLVLGLTGAGGSIVAVPLLMAAYRWTLPQAAPVALVAVAVSSALGAYTAWRRSYVRYRAAALMGLTGVLVSPLGLLAAHWLPTATLTIVFAAVMAIVALRMWRQASKRPAEAQIVRATVAGEGPPARGHVLHVNPATGRLQWNPFTALVIALIGAVTGFLSGLLGVGGGFVIVPALRAVSPLSMQSAIATSLMTIAVIASGTVLWAAAHGPGLPWAEAAPFALGAIGGMLLGRQIAPQLAIAHLERIFAALMLLIAAGLCGRAGGLW